MKKYRTGNKFYSDIRNMKEIDIRNMKEIDIRNMKEIDIRINGNEDDGYYFKVLQVVNNKLDNLMHIIERSRIREFMILTDSKRRLFTINFIAGVGKGFGQAIGFSVLTAIVLYLISKWVNLPIVGAYIAKFLDIIDQFRKN